MTLLNKKIILYSIFILFFEWFRDENMLYGVMLILNIIFLIIFSYKSIFEIKKNVKFESLINIIILLMVYFVMIYGLRIPKATLETYLFEDSRKKVIEMIKSGNLKEDSFGNVILPADYAYLSKSGEMAIYDIDDKQIYAFWIFRGVPDGRIQVIYSDNIQYIKLLYGEYILFLKEIKDNWYYVSVND